MNNKNPLPTALYNNIMSVDVVELEREEERHQKLLREIRELESRSGIPHRGEVLVKSTTIESEAPISASNRSSIRTRGSVDIKEDFNKTNAHHRSVTTSSLNSVDDDDMEELELRKAMLSEQLQQLSMNRTANDKGIRKAEEVITNLENENKMLKEALQQERNALQQERESLQREKDSKRRKLAEFSRKLKQSENQLQEANRIIGSALTEVRIVAAQVPTSVPSHVHKSISHVEELLAATADVDSEDDYEESISNEINSSQNLDSEMSSRINRLEYLNSELQKLSSERSTLHTRFAEVSAKKNSVLSAHPNTTDQRLKDIVSKVEGCAQTICVSMDRLAAREAKIVQEKCVLDDEIAELNQRRDRHV